MTNTPTMIRRLSGPSPHPTAAVPTCDRSETASTDSFLAGIAPGWTVVTCLGAPRTNGGSLHNEEQL
jgi:hypothetical protein